MFLIRGEILGIGIPSLRKIIALRSTESGGFGDVKVCGMRGRYFFYCPYDRGDAFKH